MTPVSEHYGEFNKEEKGKKTQGLCQTSLASFRQGLQGIDTVTTGINQDQIAKTSFERSNVDTPNYSSNVEATERSVALPQLQQTQQIQYKLLRRLWWSLGGLHGPFFCAPQPTTTAKTSTDVFSSFAAVGIVRKILFKLDATGNMAGAGLGRLGERLRDFKKLFYQKISAVSETSSRPSSTAQSTKAPSPGKEQQGQGQREQRLERPQRQRKAYHRAPAMVFKCSPTSCADVGYASAVKSRGQTARDRVGAQKERRSRIADIGKRSRCLPEQDGHLQAPQGSHCPWGCQDGSFGSPPSKGEPSCVLETVPGVSNHDVEILHRRLRQGGQTSRRAHRQGGHGLASCPELIRRGQESSDRGGAPRPNRDHRGRRRGIGQDCKVQPSHARRAQRHVGWPRAVACENGGDLRRNRQQAPKGGRWQKVICHAAFWWGRSLGQQVNDQWPMDTSCSLLKWGHTCIYEDNFLSPWQAVDDAWKLSAQLHEPPPQPHRDSWEHRAYSWEQLQSTSSLLQLIGLTTACRHSTCRIMLKGFPFAMFDRLEYLEAADNIAIHIRSDSTTESDRVDLMQRSSSMGRQHAIDMTGRATECEGFQTPHLNPDAPEFIPGVPNLWTQPADINDLYAAWRIGAIDRQAGEPAAQFQVWFLCPEGGYRRCLHPRRVTLWANVDDWREQLSSAWSDHLLPGFPFGIHLVRPNPPHMESDITAHIILTQLFANRAAGVLITIQDDAVNNRLPYRIAVTVPNPCQQSHVRGETGYTHEAASFRLGSGNLNYEEHQAIPTRHSTGLHLIVTHAFLDPRGASSSQSQDVGTGGLNLLQRGISIQSTGSERLTHGAVAQAHGPETSKILALEHLIEAPTNTVAVRLRAGHSDLQVPQYVEIPTPASPENVTAELCHWGLDCVALQFGSNDQFLCFRKDYNVACTGFHYMFCNSDVHDSHGCILHSQANELTQCGMMKLLDSLGYARAVILNIEILPFDMHRVTFCDNVPMFANKSPTERDRNGHSGIRFRGSMDHFTLQNSLSPI